MRIFSLVLSVILFVLFVLIVTGYLVGSKYSGEEIFFVDYSAQSVFNVLNNFESFENKNEVESVEVIARYQNLYAWQENLKSGDIRKYRQNLKQDSKSDFKQLIIELTDSDSGIIGTWNFQLTEKDSKTEVKIIEDSINPDILSRGIRFYLGRDIESIRWSRFIRSELFSRLITTP